MVIRADTWVVILIETKHLGLFFKTKTFSDTTERVMISFLGVYVLLN